MKPYARYVFSQNPNAKTRYLLTQCEGETIRGFPSVYKRGEYKGQGYIGFRETVAAARPGHRYFTHTFELEKGRTFTGVSFTETNPNKTYGDDKNLGLNDCVLIEFSPDRRVITMLFYRDMEVRKEELYQKWLVGLLPSAVQNGCLMAV